MMIQSKPIVEKAPWVVRKLIDWLEWGDHEYLRGEWKGKWPNHWMLTIYEPRMRRGWRRAFPWRVRSSWSAYLRLAHYSCCTICGRKITREEIKARDGLIHALSGSVWHVACEKSRMASGGER